MKNRRQALILELIEGGSVTSQEQLRSLLKEKGVEATQATLSRDIRDLGLVKRSLDGAYRRPDAADEPADHVEEFETAVTDYLRRHDRVEQLIVLKTDAGYSQPLAEAIDRARVPETIGTIAGENTILVICRSAAAAEAFQARLDELMKVR
jgi:transcriptional regulator of arginine metabolism